MFTFNIIYIYTIYRYILCVYIYIYGLPTATGDFAIMIWGLEVGVRPWSLGLRIEHLFSLPRNGGVAFLLFWWRGGRGDFNLDWILNVFTTLWLFLNVSPHLDRRNWYPYQWSSSATFIVEIKYVKMRVTYRNSCHRTFTNIGSYTKCFGVQRFHNSGLDSWFRSWSEPFPYASDCCLAT